MRQRQCQPVVEAKSARALSWAGTARRRGGLWSRDCQAVVRLRPWRARAARNALRRTTRAQPAAFASALYTRLPSAPLWGIGAGRGGRRGGQSRGGSWKAGGRSVYFRVTTAAAAAPRRATTSGRPSIPRRCHRPAPKSMPRNATSRNHPPDLCHQRTAPILSPLLPFLPVPSLLLLSPSRPSGYVCAG